MATIYLSIDRGSLGNFFYYLIRIPLCTFFLDKNYLADSCFKTLYLFIIITPGNNFLLEKERRSSDRNMPHNKWCQTVQLEPEVISISFIPIASLLSGTDGSGFLGHAINLYLRCKQNSHCSLNSSRSLNKNIQFTFSNVFLLHMLSEHLIRTITVNLRRLSSLLLYF